MYLPHHAISLFLVVVCVLSLMMLAAVQKSALEPRRRPRACPSCGREAPQHCSCRDN